MIIIPDGPLNSLPLHALAYEKNNNCLDCRHINFNLKNIILVIFHQLIRL